MNFLLPFPTYSFIFYLFTYQFSSSFTPLFAHHRELLLSTIAIEVHAYTATTLDDAFFWVIEWGEEKRGECSLNFGSPGICAKVNAAACLAVHLDDRRTFAFSW